MEKDIIQYVPFSSCVDPGFWHKFSQIKLEIDRLTETRRPIYGNFCYREDIGCIFEVSGTSFNSSPDISKQGSAVHGVLLNKNTIEDFKDCDKVEILNNEGKLIWEDITNGKWITNPQLLQRFLILSFADLKKFTFYYWFAFPAPSKPIAFFAEKGKVLEEEFNEKQMFSLQKQFAEFPKEQQFFFHIKANANDVIIKKLISVCKVEDDNLIAFNFNEDEMNCTYFGFIDPSNTENPSWVLRNYIAALTYTCKKFRGADLSFIAMRVKQNACIMSSKVYKIRLPTDSKDIEPDGWVGWERNDRGKFGPRLANMASSMDPIRLAESSADLNLKLMKWRLLPELNLDIIKRTKCLLLGAGTLGCSVARNLIAWGIREITFIDNGKVSYSNPVRQSLYTHENCLNGGEFKAKAAAESIKKIIPSAKSHGICLHIPMPGHPIGESLRAETIASINILVEAIQNHDIIFLLLDSREARWLPTLLGAYHNKIVINAALGFDSYVVMRHGISQQNGNTEKNVNDGMFKRNIPGNELGCYFCNDVTAPGNSQIDRTLDQQCTVTRPGVSAIAGALAVELAIALLQHADGSNAQAIYNASTSFGHVEDSESILGPIPHSIRGFLTSYQQVLPSSAKFRQCIACSQQILNLYEKEKIKLLLEVFNSARYLEEVTGLQELHLAAEMTEMLALSDTDED